MKRKSQRRTPGSKVFRTPKMKSIRRKIREQKAKSKKLSNEYKRLFKSESKRLAKKYVEPVPAEL